MTAPHSLTMYRPRTDWSSAILTLGHRKILRSVSLTLATMRCPMLIATSFACISGFDILDDGGAPHPRRLNNNLQPSPAPTGEASPPPPSPTMQKILAAATFVPYPGYTGPLAVAGTVAIITEDTTQTIEMAFTGLDTACAGGAGSAANSCGVHIHSGKTCSDASLVGGHYYTVGGHYYTNDVMADPWTSVAYSSTDGTYTSTATVTTGGDAAAIAGRAFIVHGYDGGRIGCALLGQGATLSAGPFAPYPGYSGDLAVSGTVSQMRDGWPLAFAYYFSSIFENIDIMSQFSIYLWIRPD